MGTNIRSALIGQVMDGGSLEAEVLLAIAQTLEETRDAEVRQAEALEDQNKILARQADALSYMAETYRRTVDLIEKSF